MAIYSAGRREPDRAAEEVAKQKLSAGEFARAAVKFAAKAWIRGTSLRELKRRNVYRVGVGYAVIAWLVIQVVAMIVPALMLCRRGITTAVVLATIPRVPGCPRARVGLRAHAARHPPLLKRIASGAATPPKRTARKLIALVVVVVCAKHSAIDTHRSALTGIPFRSDDSDRSSRRATGRSAALANA